MKTFTIDNGNRIIAHASKAVAREGIEADPSSFASEVELEALTSGWPSARLVALWNSQPGVVAVKKFTDRTTAVRRLWKAIQKLEPVLEPVDVEKAGGNRARRDSKKARVLALLQKSDGVTVQQIMAATDWQPHTVRGFLSGTVGKQMGLYLTSERRSDGQRVYRLAAPNSGEAV
jgi:hypothetical protein